jgi:hypothetical protein
MDKSTTREPGYPGTFEKNLSITRVVKGRVFWTHYKSPQIESAFLNVITVHGSVAALDAAEDDVGLERTRNESVTKRPAAVVTVGGPPRSR